MDRRKPENGFYSWLVTFPVGTIFNNMTTQRSLDRTVTNVTIQPGKFRGISNKVVNAQLTWSIEEHIASKDANDSDFTDEDFKKLNF